LNTISHENLFVEESLWLGTKLRGGLLIVVGKATGASTMAGVSVAWQAPAS